MRQGAPGLIFQINKMSKITKKEIDWLVRDKYQGKKPESKKLDQGMRELVQIKRVFDDKAGLVARYASARAEARGATEAADPDRAAVLGTLADAIFDQAWLAPTGQLRRNAST